MGNPKKVYEKFLSSCTSSYYKSQIFKIRSSRKISIFCEFNSINYLASSLFSDFQITSKSSISSITFIFQIALCLMTFEGTTSFQKYSSRSALKVLQSTSRSVRIFSNQTYCSFILAPFKKIMKNMNVIVIISYPAIIKQIPLNSQISKNHNKIIIILIKLAITIVVINTSNLIANRLPQSMPNLLRIDHPFKDIGLRKFMLGKSFLVA